MGAEVMSKRSNSSNNNNAKKARQHTSPTAHERPEDAKARGGREAGAGLDNKARNAGDRFDRDASNASHGGQGHSGAGAAAGADRDRAAAARAGAGAAGARDEARAKNRDR